MCVRLYNLLGVSINQNGKKEEREVGCECRILLRSLDSFNEHVIMSCIFFEVMRCFLIRSMLIVY